MRVEEAIGRRRAKRAFLEKRVDSKSKRDLVKAMRLSASCFNNQPWKVILVDENGPLDEIREALSRGNRWATRAPLIIVVTAEREKDCLLPDRRDYFLFDCGLAVGQMMLAATSMDLIAHPIAGYRSEVVREVLSIPEEQVIITLVICGHPGEDTSLLSEKQLVAEKERPERRPLNENFFYGGWGGPFE